MKVSRAKPKGYPVQIYCDESLNRGGYDVLGGLWLTRPQAVRLREKIRRLRARHSHTHEFKWVKASGSSLSPVYREFGEMIANQVAGSKGGGFHAIVISKRFVDHRQYHGGDHELAFYKFWHLLFRKRVEPGQTYIVHLDARTDRQSSRLADLRNVLNNCGRKDHGLEYDCCRDVIPVDSKTDDLVQAADVLVGALGFHRAGAHKLPGASAAKAALAARIAACIGRPLVCTPTRADERGFNVWQWRPRLG